MSHPAQQSISDALLDALAHASDGLKRVELHAIGGRHWKAAEIDDALATLESAGQVRRGKRLTAGRTAQVWQIIANEGAPGQAEGRTAAKTASNARPDVTTLWESWRDAQRRKLGLEVHG
jgi:hypothetical protein